MGKGEGAKKREKKKKVKKEQEPEKRGKREKDDTRPKKKFHFSFPHGKSRERQTNLQNFQIVVGITCVHKRSFFLMQNGTLYASGMNTQGELGVISSEENIVVPKKIPNFKFQIPRNWGMEWQKIFQWIFLGKTDKNSIFNMLPGEVHFYFVLLISLQ